MAVALALPPKGRIIACDIDNEYTNIAKRYWVEGGVADKIDLRIGPALDTLNVLLELGEADSYDLAFIDADKSQYEDYYELCLKLLRVGGLIIVDNVFQQGKVVTNSNANESVRAICTFNMKLLKDDRVDISLIPMSDGITLARKN